MRVVKPIHVGVLSRPYDHDNRFRLCVTGLVLFPFAEPRFPMSEATLWILVGEALGATVFDESMPKRQGEVLVRSSAYTPGGTPQKVIRAAVDLNGALLKEVVVVGDRVWKNGAPTEPEPFTSMSLTWDRAFGGEGFAKNPLGKGYKAKDGDPLPNVENRKALITSPKDVPEPMSFDPYDLTWPQRMQKVGTYDAQWLEKYYPGLARDIDWDFFSVAPPDQRITGFFRGDEEFVLHNLHPTQPELRAKLPEVALRCFMRRVTRAGSESQSEIEMKLDTVWLFPEHGHGVVVFHGTAPVREDDARDVSLLYLACEDLGERKSIEHYDAVLKKRLDKDTAARAVFDDKPLLPKLRAGMVRPPQLDDEMRDLVAQERLSYKNMKRREAREVAQVRDELRSYGLDPDEHGPGVPEDFDVEGSLEEVLARADAYEAKMAEEQKKLEAKHKERVAEMRKLCAEVGLDYSTIEKEWTEPKGGPPKPVAEMQIERMRALGEEGRAHGFDVKEIDDYLGDPDYMGLIQQQDQARIGAYRVSAQDQVPANLRPDSESQRMRAELLAAHGRGESLARRDLTGVNLAGIDLAGADLEEALMERANFSQANLAGANLKGAVLVRANLKGARLDSANLASANLSRAEISGTSFVEADMSEAMLYNMTFVGAVLDGVNLYRAQFGDTRLERCSLRRVRAAETSFDELDLAETCFDDADLKDATFMKCSLDGASFRGATLEKATFFGCKGTRVSFAGAKGKSLRVVEGADFVECDFRGAYLEAACMRGGNFRGSDFSGAEADLADLSECNLEGAQLVRLRAKQSRFVRANLTRANATGADFFEASLSKAILDGANLADSNLYQSDLSMVHTDGGTVLTGAFSVRARVKPRWEDKVQDLE